MKQPPTPHWRYTISTTLKWEFSERTGVYTAWSGDTLICRLWREGNKIHIDDTTPATNPFQILILSKIYRTWPGTVGNWNI